VNELEKMVWAAAYALGMQTATEAGRHNPTQVALADAAFAVDKLRNYRRDQPDSPWLPEELRS
jgi:hypothetical protein